MTLDAEEFIRRFLLHILPGGFRKLRHYGLCASRDKQKCLKLCRRLTNTPPSKPLLSTTERLRHLLGKYFDRCPRCKTGRPSREPPAVAIA